MLFSSVLNLFQNILEMFKTDFYFLLSVFRNESRPEPGSGMKFILNPQHCLQWSKIQLRAF
jgi:hypothetical protein